MEADELFRRFDVAESATSFETNVEQGELINIWREGIALMSTLYYPNVIYQYGLTGTEEWDEVAERYGFRYRVNIASVAVRTSKVSLDLCLTGYYHQSYALSRSVYETFRRMLFVRRWPHKVFRFFPENMISDRAKAFPNYRRKTKAEIDGAEWKAFEKWLRRQEDAERDLLLLGAARRKGLDLNAHAHPDLEGFADLMGVVDGHLNPFESELLPKPYSKRMQTCLKIGILGVTLILYEMYPWGVQAPEWRTQWSEWLSKRPEGGW